MSALRSDADYNIAPMRTTTFSKKCISCIKMISHRKCAVKKPLQRRAVNE